MHVVQTTETSVRYALKRVSLRQKIYAKAIIIDRISIKKIALSTHGYGVWGGYMILFEAKSKQGKTDWFHVFSEPCGKNTFTLLMGFIDALYGEE